MRLLSTRVGNISFCFILPQQKKMGKEVIFIPILEAWTTTKSRKTNAFNTRKA